MATHVVRKGSIYRTWIVLKTKTNLYFYRMWSGISYWHTSHIILPKLLFHNKPHPPSISHHFNLKSTKIVYFHTDTQSSGMDNILNIHTASIFRQPPEDASSIFLRNTAPQSTCYFNPDHFLFLHHCENLK
jgi:hypothetical protein